jgi:hypothetical protein
MKTGRGRFSLGGAAGQVGKAVSDGTVSPVIRDRDQHHSSQDAQPPLGFDPGCPPARPTLGASEEPGLGTSSRCFELQDGNPSLLAGNWGRVAGIELAAGNRFNHRHDFALLYMTQHLPVGDEDDQDTHDPAWHSCLGGHQKELPAVGAVIGTLHVSVLPHELTTIRAVALHGVIPGAGR